MTSTPLSSLRVIEFAALGPGPFAGQLLADLGAEVIVIDRPERAAVSLEESVERRGKRSIILDLKTADGIAVALDLIARSDLLIEGSRPGVMERLGLGPDTALARNPRLVYGRMTGWGQTGPYAQMAGHDINYIGLTGALAAMGPPDGPPPPPLNLLGDFGGGSMMLVMGLLAAHIEAARTGKGSVVDAAIIDGVSALMGMIHSWHGAGRWTPERGTNILDGGAPFYRCYETADGKYLSVGAIEPQFFAELLQGLGFDPDTFGNQWDRSLWPAYDAAFQDRFLSKTRDAWTAIFEGTDACVAPVLDYREMAEHPQNRARLAVTDAGSLRHPRAAPVFDAAIAPPNTDIPVDGRDSRPILQELGYDRARIDALFSQAITRGPE